MKICALDTETMYFDPEMGVHLLNAPFICGAVAAPGEETRYFNQAAKLVQHLSTYEGIFIHNSSFDLKVLSNAGHPLPRSERVMDTMVMGWLLDENSPIGLDDLSRRYLGKQKIKVDFKDTSCAALADYVKQDADLCLGLGLKFLPLLEEQGLLDLFKNIDMPFLRLLDEMRDEGIEVDRKRLAAEADRVRRKTQAIAAKFAAKGVNINSCKQVSKVLYYFPELVPKQKDGSPKTDEGTLGRVPPELLRPEAAEIMEYRKDAKLLGTFLEGMQNAIQPDTGLVHPIINLCVAKTGRTSSGGNKKNYPYSFNIQNVAKENAVLRSSVIPKPGTAMVILDAKELELRVLAHYSEDPGLLKVFNEGTDAHVYTASMLYDKPMSEVTREERSIAKTLNYAVLYGTTAHGLTYSLGLNKDRAQDLMDRFYQAYPSIRALKRAVQERYAKDGYIQSLYGRRRRGDLDERELFSAYIQGTAADLMKECHVHSRPLLPRHYRPFIFVHDEFGYYVPKEEAEEAVLAIRGMYEMGHRPFRVPILFTSEVRATWAKEA